MAVTWKTQGLDVIYTASVAAKFLDGSVQTATLNVCDSATAPEGFTDPSVGTTYEPRMSGLVISKTLGGFSLKGRNGLHQETARFQIQIGGYEDSSFWTDWIGGDSLNRRFNGATVTIKAWERGNLSNVEWLHVGEITSRITEFKPNGKIGIRSRGGHYLMERPLIMETYQSGDFEDNTSTGRMDDNDGAAGRVKPWVWGHIGSMDVTCIESGNGTAINMGSNYSRLVCVGYRLGTDSGAGALSCGDGFGSYKDASNVLTVAEYLDDPTDVTSTDATNYTKSGRNFGCWILNDSSPAYPQPEEDADQTITLPVFYNSDNETPADVLDHLMFTAGGVAYLSTVDSVETQEASGLVWAEWESEFDDETNYNISGVIPHVQRAEQVPKNAPKLGEVVCEALWITGSDLWWEYNASGAREYYIEKRDTSARHPAGSFDAKETFTAREILPDSLGVIVDPYKDYANDFEIAEAPRYAGSWDATSGDQKIPDIGQTIYTETVSAETSAGLNTQKSAKYSLRWFDGIGSSIMADRVDDLAQEHVYFEWAMPIQFHDKTLHDLVDFNIGSFPGTACQIREKTVNYSKGEITFRATTASGNYNV